MRYLIIFAAIILGFGTMSMQNAGATVDMPSLIAPAGPAAAAVRDTKTAATSWVHQCAAMHCGYHEIGPGQPVKVACYVRNEGIIWNLILASSPWDQNVPIVGFVSDDALTAPEYGTSCDEYGPGAPSELTWWAHSCPRMACGYGIINKGDYYRVIGSASDGWWIAMDFSSPDNHLTGFIHE
ncbi:hypothetical protein [Nocardia sp. NPDC052566]|uniref:hypothetical protein n=1 Tax=Nocardia sp. NPDC052566 TaxID=3364330 RepID=UPI0037CA48DC